MKMSDLHGAVTKCDRCSNANPETPMPCAKCFCRGFVAACLQCNGTGQIEESVVGGAKGMMLSTCPGCGGTKCFGVNKPVDWDAAHPSEPVKTAEQVALDSPPPAGNVIPPMRRGAHVTPVAASV
jgi:hypothetical protein